MPDRNTQPESLAAAITEVSDRMVRLVHDEIDLAKAEMAQKVRSVAVGSAAIGAGAVFGVFAVIFALLTVAWAINDAVGDLWLGFLVVFGVLIVLALGSGLLAWRKLRVGAPTPTMAIDEARKIQATITARGGGTEG